MCATVYCSCTCWFGLHKVQYIAVLLFTAYHIADLVWPKKLAWQLCTINSCLCHHKYVSYGVHFKTCNTSAVLCRERWDGDAAAKKAPKTEFVVLSCPLCQHEGLKPWPICRRCADTFSVGTHCPSRLVGNAAVSHCCSLTRPIPANFYRDAGRCDVFQPAKTFQHVECQTTVPVQDGPPETAQRFRFGLGFAGQVGKGLRNMKFRPKEDCFL